MLILEETPNIANCSLGQFLIDAFRTTIPFDHNQNGGGFMFFSREDIPVKLVPSDIDSFEGFYVKTRKAIGFKSLRLNCLNIFQIT